MAKDETEEGITGQPIPKRKLGPAKRHKFEKKRRAARKERNDPRAGDSFSQHRMTGSRGHGSEYQNTRSVREEVLSYLLDEGFASDEKSAQAIANAMSEEWKQNIIEAVTGGSAPQMPASVVKFVDELPGKIQSALQGKPPSSAKPKPKKLN